METETVKQKIERLQIKAELFLKENKKCFIRDVYNNYYFCFIIFSGEDNLRIQNFKGKRLVDGIEKENIYWVDISDIQDYKEKEELGCNGL
jgi:hypothetical protein